jgi:hypothetical protein
MNNKFADALDRIARFAEAYEAAKEKHPEANESVGEALCITLGHYARKVLSSK